MRGSTQGARIGWRVAVDFWSLSIVASLSGPIVREGSNYSVPHVPAARALYCQAQKRPQPGNQPAIAFSPPVSEAEG